MILGKKNNIRDWSSFAIFWFLKTNHEISTSYLNKNLSHKKIFQIFHELLLYVRWVFFLFGLGSIIDVMKFDKRAMLLFLKLQKQLQASNI